MKRNTLQEGRCLQLDVLGCMDTYIHCPANTIAYLASIFYCCYFTCFWQRSQIQINGPMIHPGVDLSPLDLHVDFNGNERSSVVQHI